MVPNYCRQKCTLESLNKRIILHHNSILYATMTASYTVFQSKCFFIFSCTKETPLEEQSFLLEVSQEGRGPLVIFGTAFVWQFC